MKNLLSPAVPSSKLAMVCLGLMICWSKRAVFLLSIFTNEFLLQIYTFSNEKSPFYDIFSRETLKTIPKINIKSDFSLISQ